MSEQWHKKARKQSWQQNNIFLISLFIISLIAGYIVLRKADRNFHIREYISSRQETTGEDFFAKHYQVPAIHDVIFNKKKNLVIVMAESLENSFSDPRIGPSLTPHLDLFRKSSEHHMRQIQIQGTGWTIGAMTAWHFGLPLKLSIDGNTYSAKFGHTTFLPNALSIFDILAENGYEQVLLLGSDRKYSGKDNIYKHGKFRIKDSAHWKKSGYDLDKFRGTDWGYNDAFLFNRATEEYQKLSKSGRNFVLIIETVDTHFPDGFCPENERIHHDIRDAILRLDRELGKFLEENFAKKIENTVVAVLGDHCFMGFPDFLSPVKERTIFNAFYGDIPSISKRKQKEKISALDIAPTLLEAAGAKWDSSRFGLGVSLFSDEPSLISVYDSNKLNYKIMQYSTLYQSFF